MFGIETPPRTRPSTYKPPTVRSAPAVVSRDAVRRALALHATALILVVSRPGAAAPDKDELAMATRLKQAAGVLSIALHDVLLAGDGKRVSLRRKGVL